MEFTSVRANGHRFLGKFTLVRTTLKVVFDLKALGSKRWIVDRATLRQARAEDVRYVDDPEYLEYLPIFFANVISKLGKKLQLRQRVIATATVFFRRFYVKNLYCETDPFIVVAACCYVAAKSEESPVPIKNVVNEARNLFSNENFGIKTFTSDNSKLAEMEFYLVDDLECDLTVFHPYRTLLTLCRKSSAKGGPGEMVEAEAGELGTGVDDGQRYWGTGEGQLELEDGALQMAWFVINDTYRSELCLLYPPHLIAIAAIYFTIVLHDSTCKKVLQRGSSNSSPLTKPQPEQTTPTQAPRRSSRQANHATDLEGVKKSTTSQDPIQFLADLNVSLPLIATIAQEIISLYTLWSKYKEDTSPENTTAKTSLASSVSTSQTNVLSPGGGVSGATKRSAAGFSLTASTLSGAATPGNLSTAADAGSEGYGQSAQREKQITPAFLVAMLQRMREARFADMTFPPNSGVSLGPTGGRTVAVNKMLERTQAAG